MSSQNNYVLIFLSKAIIKVEKILLGKIFQVFRILSSVEKLMLIIYFHGYVLLCVVN